MSPERYATHTYVKTPDADAVRVALRSWHTLIKGRRLRALGAPTVEVVSAAVVTLDGGEQLRFDLWEDEVTGEMVEGPQFLIRVEGPVTIPA